MLYGKPFAYMLDPDDLATPIPVEIYDPKQLRAYNKFLMSPHRIVAKTTVWNDNNPQHGQFCFVSTVFLGQDHGWGDGPPVLWETMVFEATQFDGYQERYTSLADAREGHKRAVRLCEVSQRPDAVWARQKNDLRRLGRR